ncbi:hypothetical protein CWS72_26515 [Telmatospirillum siberiense]|uniref:Uncharacterized protein n=1 Tax=Telmatospirillum siberiense TaxID=382514 RepID=A0A2N3PM60_9PROT|nr:hypothetical protein CWS72_26515 [Telmatospirillum siberiense]
MEYRIVQRPEEMVVSPFSSWVGVTSTDDRKLNGPTSEDLVTVKNFVADIDRQLLVFERRLIDRIAPDA